MTQLEWEQLEATVAGMTPAERERLKAILEASSARDSEKPILGLFADESELVDEVVTQAHVARETHPLRLPDDG